MKLAKNMKTMIFKQKLLFSVIFYEIFMLFKFL